MDALEEKKLLFRIQNGDKEAFGEVYDEYVTKIYRFVWLKVSSQETAQDLTSEIFLKSWRYLVKDDTQKSKIRNLQAFLYKVARNVIIDFYRKRSDPVSIEEIEEDIIDDRLNASEKLYLEDDLKEVKKALDRIKDEYSQVIILYYLEEIPIREIADILDKSEGATRVIIHRALKALRNELK